MSNKSHSLPKTDLDFSQLFLLTGSTAVEKGRYEKVINQAIDERHLGNEITKKEEYKCSLSGLSAKKTVYINEKTKKVCL